MYVCMYVYVQQFHPAPKRISVEPIPRSPDPYISVRDASFTWSAVEAEYQGKGDLRIGAWYASRWVEAWFEGGNKTGGSAGGHVKRVDVHGRKKKDGE